MYNFPTPEGLFILLSVSINTRFFVKFCVVTNFLSQCNGCQGVSQSFKCKIMSISHFLLERKRVTLSGKVGKIAYGV